MSFGEIVHTFFSNIKDTRWQEWVSTLTQIASVWYAKKNNVLVYPTGIIGVLLAAYVYYFLARPPLYADAILNLYYFAMSVYGWYNWVQKKKKAAWFIPLAGALRKNCGLALVSFCLAGLPYIFYWFPLPTAIPRYWIRWFHRALLRPCGGWLNVK